jgi:hypothetical protein
MHRHGVERAARAGLVEGPQRGPRLAGQAGEHDGRRRVGAVDPALGAAQRRRVAAAERLDRPVPLQVRLVEDLPLADRPAREVGPLVPQRAARAVALDERAEDARDVRGACGRRPEPPRPPGRPGRGELHDGQDGQPALRGGGDDRVGRGEVGRHAAGVAIARRLRRRDVLLRRVRLEERPVERRPDGLDAGDDHPIPFVSVACVERAVGGHPEPALRHAPLGRFRAGGAGQQEQQREEGDPPHEEAPV